MDKKIEIKDTLQRVSSMLKEIGKSDKKINIAINHSDIMKRLDRARVLVDSLIVMKE